MKECTREYIAGLQSCSGVLENILHAGGEMVWLDAIAIFAEQQVEID